MDSLPTDLIAHILSYVYRPQHQPLYAHRTINRAFNAAVISFRPMWIEILGDKGPYMIGPDSRHMGIWQPGGCKISRKTGKCYISTHYFTHTLIPRYDDTVAFNAYDTAIKIIHEKYTRRMHARIKYADRKMATLEQNYNQKKRALTYQREDAVDRLKRAKR